MAKKEAERFAYSTTAVADMIAGGAKGSRIAIRGWVRQQRINGVFHRTKNAKYWFSRRGVLQAWELWAEHTGQDPEADMPAKVMEIAQALEADAGGGGESGKFAITITIAFDLPANAQVHVAQVA